jgi:RNA polymerase sigma factor (sigma-70 family)
MLVLRYAAAVRRYVGGILSKPEDADELAQDVVVRLLRGDFAGADPERGRFRDLLKTAVRNMIHNHWARQNRRCPVAMDLERLPGPTDDSLDASWLAAWQTTILDHAWSALNDFEQAHPRTHAYTLLRLRAEAPDATSEELAARLSATTGTTIRLDACRQMLRRARLQLAQTLVKEVEMGLAEPTPERVEEELASLGLLDYVRDFLPPDWNSCGRLAEA